MHLVTDDDEAYDIVRRLMAALPSGSHLVLAHACIDAEATRTAIDAYNDSGIPTPIKGRSANGIARFFDGLDLLEPGVVTCPDWRPDPGDTTGEVMTFCGVAAKP
jgi:S-adenosyl methyltransferase